ncbi:hypothetical protein VTI28DRAFT_1039 [Corynascus sepedonium]
MCVMRHLGGRRCYRVLRPRHVWQDRACGKNGKKMFSALFHRRSLPALAASCVPRRRKPIAERRRWQGTAHSPAASLCPSPHGGWLHSEDPAICLLQIEDLGSGMRVTPKVSSLRIKCVRCAYFAPAGGPKPETARERELMARLRRFALENEILDGFDWYRAVRGHSRTCPAISGLRQLGARRRCSRGYLPTRKERRTERLPRLPAYGGGTMSPAQMVQGKNKGPGSCGVTSFPSLHRLGKFVVWCECAPWSPNLVAFWGRGPATPLQLPLPNSFLLPIVLQTLACHGSI